MPPAADVLDRLGMRSALAFIWLATGCAVLTPSYRHLGEEYLKPLGLPAGVMFVACGAEVLLGLWVLSGRWDSGATIVQGVLILGFTFILAVTQPRLWVHPFGVLGKNLPLLAFVAVSWLLPREGWSPRATWLLRGGVALIWITEGLLPLLLFQQPELRDLIREFDLPAPDPEIVLYAAGVGQIVLALTGLVVRGTWLRLVTAAQAAGLVVITLLVTYHNPLLWLHPFGPLTKNISILLGTLVLLRRADQV